MKHPEEPLGEVLTTAEDAYVLGELLGPDWRGIPLSEGEAAINDAMARATAEWGQVQAEHKEAQRFSRAVLTAMRERGATYCREVYDDVARELYGHDTPLTRRVIAEVEMFANETSA